MRLSIGADRHEPGTTPQEETRPQPTSPTSSPYGLALEKGIWKIYRDFFDTAERRRRWSLRDDVPWEQCNAFLDPAIASVVESFCAVELFLPDYVGKFLPLVRGFRGRAWFAANWGYEES